MSHTNETLHYGLPQFIGTDILDPLTDTNEAYQKIDETMYEVAQQGTQAEEDSAEAKQIAQAIDGRVTIVENEVVELGTGIVQTRAMIAAPFDALKVNGYEIGDYVTFDNKLYKFVKKHTGAWSASDVDEVAICDDAVRIRKMVAPFFDPNKQGGYEAGAWVIYNDGLYVFTADHSGVWTGTDVDAIDIGYAVDRIEGTLHYPSAGEEVICGYDSDNAPVYRRHFSGTNTTPVTFEDCNRFSLFEITGVKRLVNCYGEVRRYQDNASYSIPLNKIDMFYSSPFGFKSSSACVLIENTHTITCDAFNNASISAYQPRYDYDIIVEYTKI